MVINPGNTGIVGIIRDRQGNMVAIFTKNIGLTPNNKAEVWAFYHGITLAANLEITKLIIETDSIILQT